MKWTKEKPKEPGVYWYRTEYSPPSILRVDYDSFYMILGEDNWAPMNTSFQFEFKGPIHPEEDE